MEPPKSANENDKVKNNLFWWTEPVDLEKEDLIGLKQKAESIIRFLNHTKNYQEKSLIVALYGNWGSGKTSIVNYIEKEKKKDNEFLVIKINAWQHAKDGNLILSILNSIKENNSSTKDAVKSVLNNIWSVVADFSTSSSINISPISFNIDRAVEKQKLRKVETNYRKIMNLNKQYQEIENIVLEKNQKLLILIDEIDRCEPELTINLINFLKLFFAYGKRSIFLITADENALVEAIKTKYGDAIKGKEYLEKIFDYSFSMPSENPLKELLNYYLNDKIYTEFEIEIIDILTSFLQAIKFTNPRKVKKVLSKFLYIKSYSLYDLKGEYSAIRDIFSLKHNNVLILMIQLFLIILYEFENEKFWEIDNYDIKFSKLIEGFHDSRKENNQSISKEDDLATLKTYFYTDYKNSKISEIINNSANSKFYKFMIIFFPYLDKFIFDNTCSFQSLLSQISGKENTIIFNFLSFITRQDDLFEINTNDINIYHCFEIVKKYL